MNKEPLSKKKLQAIETKKKVFETARKLFLAYGIDNVSVDSIVEAAEVSKGTFYVHFESKDALVADLVNEYISLADMDYETFLTTLSASHSVLDILLLMAEKISDFIAVNIGLENIKVVYKAHLTKTINTANALSYTRNLYKLFTDVLERGVRQGELREDLSPEFLSRHLILAIRGITFEWCIRYPDFDLKEQVLDHFKILLYGLKR